MIIFGITGPIGHGKTTFGEALQSLTPFATHYESSQIITGLADQWLAQLGSTPKSTDLSAINTSLESLADIISNTFQVKCTWGQLKFSDHDLDTEPADYRQLLAFLDNPDTSTKESYRPLLQWLGGYLVKKVDDGIWYKQIIKNIEQDAINGISMATVGGLRYPRDADILRQAGAKIVGISRPDFGEQDQTDPTERQRQQIKLDCAISNNGDLADLQNCARRLYADISSGEVKLIYIANVNN